MDEGGFLALSEEKLIDYFYYFDVDGSGELEPDEMMMMADHLGIPHNRMALMISDMDDNGDGIIQIEEWVDYIRKVDGYLNNTDSKADSFKLFNTDKLNSIILMMDKLKKGNLPKDNENKHMDSFDDHYSRGQNSENFKENQNQKHKDQIVVRKDNKIDIDDVYRIAHLSHNKERDSDKKSIIAVNKMIDYEHSQFNIKQQNTVQIQKQLKKEYKQNEYVIELKSLQLDKPTYSVLNQDMNENYIVDEEELYLNSDRDLDNLSMAKVYREQENHDARSRSMLPKVTSFIESNTNKPKYSKQFANSTDYSSVSIRSNRNKKPRNKQDTIQEVSSDASERIYKDQSNLTGIRNNPNLTKKIIIDNSKKRSKDLNIKDNYTNQNDLGLQKIEQFDIASRKDSTHDNIINSRKTSVFDNKDNKESSRKGSFIENLTPRKNSIMEERKYSKTKSYKQKKDSVQFKSFQIQQSHLDKYDEDFEFSANDNFDQNYKSPKKKDFNDNNILKLPCINSSNLYINEDSNDNIISPKNTDLKEKSSKKNKKVKLVRTRV